MRAIYIVSLLVLFALGACSEEPTNPGQNNKPKQDMALEDMGKDTGPDVKNDMLPDMTCEPRTQCPADTCGMVSDGCGGQLDCGVCACENGSPTASTCGLCGLGTPSCEGDTFKCADVPSIPGLEGLDAAACEGAIVYVDLSSIEPGFGTKVSPFPGLRTALDALKTKPEIKTVLIKGDGSQAHSVSGLVELPNGVSFVGGFDSNWKPKPDARPLFEVGAELSNKDLVGVQAHGIDQPTLIYNLRFKVRDNSNPGGSNYGLHLKDSDALSLVNVEVESGKAGAGVDGEQGQDGQNGQPGQNATSATVDALGVNSGGFVGVASMPNFGSCMADSYCVGAAGGIGRYFNRSSNAWVEAANGARSNGGGAGGVAGTFGSKDGVSGDQGQYSNAGGNTQGKEGSPGGSLVGGYWVSSGAGADGSNGQQGSGGGGGGGAFSSGLELPPYCGTQSASCSNCVPCPAPHGGGGGGGGEGGTGGQGGQSGGSSFGILIVNSKLKMIDSLIKAGFAGAGGKGGSGGLGGRGGAGGRGSSEIQYLGQPRSTTYRGGNGAKGQDGQNGGAGGGGAGGNSYGVYCSDGQLELDALTRFEHGGSAPGGASLGNPGEDGRGLETFGCN